MGNQKGVTRFEDFLPFWDKICEEDRQFLCDNSKFTVFPKGSTIHDGDECNGIILIKSGCLRLYMLSENGRDITLYRLFSGDVCTFSASCVVHAITFDVLVDAEEDSECTVINGHAFETILEKYPDAKIFALESTVKRFSDIMWVMQQILFMSFDRRLAIFLLEESSKKGTDTIKLTHEQIAKYMGSAREVVSRMLKYFVSEGIVKTSRGGGIKILDRKRLRTISGEH